MAILRSQDVLAAHEPDSVTDVETSLFAGLGLEPAAFVRDRLAVRGRHVGTKGTRLLRFIEANPAVFIAGTVDGQPISNSSNADQRRLYSEGTLADPSSSCRVFVDWRDRWHRQFGVQRFGGVLAQAIQPRSVIPGVVHVVVKLDIDDVSSFNITGSAAQLSRWRNGSRPGSVQSGGRVFSAFDARNRFVGSYEWALPSGTMRRIGTSQRLADGS